MKRVQRDTEAVARRVNRRALLLGGGMTAMFAALGLRMRYLGVEQADEFRLLAEENRVNMRLLPPTRGVIHDRNGKILAENAQNYRVVMTREDAGDVEVVLNKLSHLIPLTRSDMDDALDALKKNSPFMPITVRDRLDWEEFSRVALNAPALPGVTPETGMSRSYPRDADFAHVIGYVGPVSEKDLEGVENPDPVLRIPKFQIGKIGVEKWMEDTLRGQAGTKQIEVNHIGRVMRELGRVEGTPGADVHLTLDSGVQNFVQARLGEESAACVVMDVQNGDVIAAVSSPSFDPNLFVRGISNTDFRFLMDHDHRPMANKAVQGAYPPGSTFKMVTALAALEAGAISPETTFHCPGHYDAGGRKFHCWRRGGHGPVNLERSLMESCDVFYYETAIKVGIDKIAEMGRKLGLGVRHDLPMSAITEGNIPDKAWKLAQHKADWVIGDTINASIGQGYVLASPLQLAVMTARVASGKAVKPRLVRAIDGQEVPVEPAESLGMSTSNLTAVQGGMIAVMNGKAGTARSSRVVADGIRMAGKTGTAQVRNISASERAGGVISNDNLPWNRRDHALFVGFAPADNPRYAVAVVVEHGGGGSAVAAPIARDAILRALYGAVPPLEAYPSDQRGRMESLLNGLTLRNEDGSFPAASDT